MYLRAFVCLCVRAYTLKHVCYAIYKYVRVCVYVSALADEVFGIVFWN